MEKWDFPKIDKLNALFPLFLKHLKRDTMKESIIF